MQKSHFPGFDTYQSMGGNQLLSQQLCKSRFVNKNVLIINQKLEKYTFADLLPFHQLRHTELETTLLLEIFQVVPLPIYELL